MNVGELFEEIEGNSQFIKRAIEKIINCFDDWNISFMDMLLVLMMLRVRILYKVMAMCYNEFGSEECGEEIMNYLNSYHELERRLVMAVVDTPKRYYELLEKFGLVRGDGE